MVAIVLAHRSCEPMTDGQMNPGEGNNIGARPEPQVGSNGDLNRRNFLLAQVLDRASQQKTVPLGLFVSEVAAWGPPRQVRTIRDESSRRLIGRSD